ALNIVLDAPIKLGETAIVFGQGTVGLLVTQLLKLAGARVIAVDPMENRRRLSLKAGGDVALEPGEGLTRYVMEETSGLGADVAIEASGSSAALRAAVDCVAPEGTVVAASWYGTKPVSLDLGGHFHRGRVRLKSSQVGSIPPELSTRWDRERRTRTVLNLLPKLRLKDLVSRLIPFEDAPEAYHLLDRNREDHVQLVFEYGDEEEEA
ncbi:MAG: zinc-dependent alcohol dehydrogenase, partial [Rubrobacteraceae bacterium]